MDLAKLNKIFGRLPRWKQITILLITAVSMNALLEFAARPVLDFALSQAPKPVEISQPMEKKLDQPNENNGWLIPDGETNHENQ